MAAPKLYTQPARRHCLLFILLLFRATAAAGADEELPAPPPVSATPGVAFYYEADIPPELAVYDAVVVQPEHLMGKDLSRHPLAGRLFAYTTVGELDNDSPYSGRLPREWLHGKNPVWNSDVIDQSANGWPDFFVREVIAPLWQQGFRGFFLDTLDSYHLIADTPEQRLAQEQGLIRLVRAVNQAYPDARLIFNRGFEILPEVHELAYAVVAESLFQGWDNLDREHVSVSGEDRGWLLEQLRIVRDQYRLPVIVIDYAPAEERQIMQDLAARIRAQGFAPWVSTAELDILGVGVHDILPRRVLIVYDAAESDSLRTAEAHRFLAAPLNYLGLVPEYRDVSAGLPAGHLAGRYAGIVVWLNVGNDQHWHTLLPWFRRQIREGVPLALLNEMGIPLQTRKLAALGLSAVDVPFRGAAISIAQRRAELGFEIAPPLTPDDQAFVKAPANAEVWLQLRRSDDISTDPVAITDWGGYALAPHAIAALPHDLGYRWVVDPFAFFTHALRLQAMPVPDVTTENGHRLLITHIDGDGFANRGEFPGTPYAGRKLLDAVLKRYRIPTTVSVIQGELASNGAYPKLSKKLEPIARAMFALPHVEIASHSYSHPFSWSGLESGEYAEGLNLKIPGYRFSETAEVDGSVRYIDNELAPPGKKTAVFLWTGNCDPGEQTLGRTYTLGIGNMNGGDTTLTRTRPTLTEVAPIGVPVGEHFQVYAPNQNESAYTNYWTGPFYGYKRVIETFELTETPRRLKPVNIYYHMYSASKPSSLRALHEVYGWALKQNLLPIYVSEYIRKAQEFNNVIVTREGNGFGIFGAHELKTLRIPPALGYPAVEESPEVLGYSDNNNVRYLHLSGSRYAHLTLQATPPVSPHIRSANGRIRDWKRDESGNLRFKVGGHVSGVMELALSPPCRVIADAKQTVTKRGDITRVRFASDPNVTDITVQCGHGNQVADGGATVTP